MSMLTEQFNKKLSHLQKLFSMLLIFMSYIVLAREKCIEVLFGENLTGRKSLVYMNQCDANLKNHNFKQHSLDQNVLFSPCFQGQNLHFQVKVFCTLSKLFCPFTSRFVFTWKIQVVGVHGRFTQSFDSC